MRNLRRSRQAILSRSTAHRLLQDYYDDFGACVQYGLNRLFSVNPEDRTPLKKRTQSGMLNDYIVADAMARFSDEPGWGINDDWDGAFFVYQQKVALRFKKVERNGDGILVPSNVTTDRQGKIGYQYEIDGIERATYVNIGYQVNAAYTAMVGVCLSCIRGDSQIWSIPICESMEAYLFDNDGNAMPAARAEVRSKSVRQDQRANG